MPPWKVSEGVAFHNERRLSDQEIQTLADWADNGTPAGDPKDAPPPREFPTGWQLGTPDLILTPADDFLLGPSGKDVFRCFVLPTNLDEDKYVAAVEMRPGNPQVVHHLLLFIDTAGQWPKARGQEPKKKKRTTRSSIRTPASRRNSIAAPATRKRWASASCRSGALTRLGAGHLARFMPDGVGFHLPKKSDVIMQVHYHRNGRAEKDRTQVGLYFAKKKIDHPFQRCAVAGGVGAGPLRYFFAIPPGADHFKLDGDTWARQDFTLLTIIAAHAPARQGNQPDDDAPRRPGAEAARDQALGLQLAGDVLPEGADPGEGGDEFPRRGVLRQRDKNPLNPFSPPRRVIVGEQTTNEMCFVFLGGYSESRLPILPLTPFAPGKK